MIGGFLVIAATFLYGYETKKPDSNVYTLISDNTKKDISNA
jgi:hypothetical protein